MPKSLSSFTQALVLGGILCVSGCSKKMPRTYLPPPQLPLTARPVLPPPFLDPPGDGELLTMVDPPRFDLPPPVFPDAPKPPAPPRPTPPPPKPTTASVSPPQEPPVPRITQMFTAEQYRAYTKDLDDTLLRVSRALEQLGKRNLTAEQRDKEEQITNFQKQAVQAREQDLVNAVNLARRADLLAKDLLERLP